MLREIGLYPLSHGRKQLWIQERIRPDLLATRIGLFAWRAVAIDEFTRAQFASSILLATVLKYSLSTASPLKRLARQSRFSRRHVDKSFHDEKNKDSSCM
jgi:hypothetical protein